MSQDIPTRLISSRKKNIDDQVINGLVAGCYQDYVNDWAGVVGRFWRPGVAILRNAEEGSYDLQWISLDALRKEYS